MTLIKSISGFRGTIGGKPGDTLSPLDAVKFAAAFGSWVNQDKDKAKIVIGRDARLSGQIISDLVSSTLLAMGIDVIDLGLSTTPTVELAVVGEKADGGIILTASHNPANWNALKLLNADGEFISVEDSLEILRLTDAEDFEFETVHNLGKLTKDDSWIDKHIQMVLDIPMVDAQAIRDKNFRVVVDAVNSTGGIAIPRLLEALGVQQVELMYCDPTGHFPHNPEPLPEHLSEISHKLENGNFNIGIAVDPDVDRLAFICEDGTPFGEEYTLVAVADYVLKNKIGNTVSNLSSTRALQDVTEKAGGTYHASAVGEVNVVKQMKSVNAVIGGEGNGGVIYPELHYGRDALVGVALFLSHLARYGKSAKMLRMSYPNYFISKNKIELTPDLDVDMVLDAMAKRYASHKVNRIDGVKIEFESEWVHLRKSNTEPIIRIYSESKSEATAEHLAQKIIGDIREIVSDAARIV